MIAKYVMTDRGVIIFPDTFLHSEFSKFKPLSAGLVIIDEDYVKVYGESISLNLKPNKGDEEIILSSLGIKKN